jgi:hypothetical protein
VSARGTFTAHACEMPFASNAQRSGPVERDEQKAEASGGYASSRYAYIAAASTITIMIRILLGSDLSLPSRWQILRDESVRRRLAASGRELRL